MIGKLAEKELQPWDKGLEVGTILDPRREGPMRLPDLTDPRPHATLTRLPGKTGHPVTFEFQEIANTCLE